MQYEPMQLSYLQEQSEEALATLGDPDDFPPIAWIMFIQAMNNNFIGNAVIAAYNQAINNLPPDDQ
jgi:hypothetical protein